MSVRHDSSAAVRLVVFDFDGVMIDFEPQLRLLEHCRVPARQAVFIDDDDQFIQGAISAGMHGIHIKSLPALRAALEPLLATRAW